MLLEGPIWVVPCTKSVAVFGKRSRIVRSSSMRNPAYPETIKRVCSAFTSVVGRSSSTQLVGQMGCPLPPVSTLQAVLFDVDGTLTDSDPLHYKCFRDMLQEEGFQGGVPITEEFFSEHISGKFNPDIGRFLFPDWEESRRTNWLDDKEALFRKLAVGQLEGKPGLSKFAEWVKTKNLRRAAVTNAPRANAKQMIIAVGLGDFFEHLIVGSECARGKPFPDPYLDALKKLEVQAKRTFVFEDSVSGVKAAVDADLAVVGIVSGNSEASLLEAGAAFTIQDFADPALWRAVGELSPE